MPFGDNSSYLAIGKRMPVYGSDGGLIGVVKKVECDRKKDIFGGLVLSTPHGQRYLLAEQVVAIHEDGIEARIPAWEAIELPQGDVTPTVQSEGVVPPPPSLAEFGRWLKTRLGLSRVDDPRLRDAEQRIERRERALRIARENPSLALEAGVGRPDVRGAFHGEVVDINNAAGAALVGLPGISNRQALRIVAVRNRVDGFSSLADFGMVMDLPGDAVERLRGLVVFLPRQAAPDADDLDTDAVPRAPA
jgi:hypothetical protein